MKKTITIERSWFEQLIKYIKAFEAAKTDARRNTMSLRLVGYCKSVESILENNN